MRLNADRIPTSRLVHVVRRESGRGILFAPSVMQAFFSQKTNTEGERVRKNQHQGRWPGWALRSVAWERLADGCRRESF